MSGPWSAWCTAAAIVALLLLVIRYKFQPFAALLVVSLALGLLAGLRPEQTVLSVAKGVGDILREVAIILALGAMLGRMLEASGAAEVIARTVLDAFGPKRASLAILLAAYVIGIPVLFNVGFLLLAPIMWRLQRETGRSLLYYMLPLAFSLAIMHSLVPPHPGIVGAVNALGGDMVEVMIFGALLGIPLVLVGWLGPGLWWAKRQFVTPPEQLMAKEEKSDAETGGRGDAGKEEGSAPALPVSPRPRVSASPSFTLSLLIVTLPLLLSLIGFGVKLLSDVGEHSFPWLREPLIAPDRLPSWLVVLSNSPEAWLRFIGHPVMALLIPAGLAFWLLGRGMGKERLSKVAGDALNDVGAMALLFGAAGGFKQVIQDTGAGDYIAGQVLRLPLSPVAVCFIVAVLMRVALGSATAAILTASALLAGLVKSLSDQGLAQATPLVLAVACGVTVMTQPADSGFWLIKEYCNLTVKQVMIFFNLCRATMAVAGLLILLLHEALVRYGILPVKPLAFVCSGD